MANVNIADLEWVVGKLVKIETEIQAIKKARGDAQAYPVASTVAATWRDEDKRGPGLPANIDAILGNIR